VHGNGVELKIAKASRIFTLVVFAGLLAFAGGVAVAESGDALPDAPVPQVVAPETAAPQTQDHRAEAARELQVAKKQRVLGVVPNFNTVINGYGVALSPGQKTDLAFRSSVDPFIFVSAALIAGLSEVQDTHKGYGWGPSGYFKRAGAAYADDFDGNMISNALFPILFHQDPRYFRKGSGPAPGTPVRPGQSLDEYGFRHRMGYAVANVAIRKGDNGRWQPNYSTVLGNLTTGAISNIYYPADERGAVLTVENALTVTAERAIGCVFAEFWPDIELHVLRVKPKVVQQ